MTEPHPILHITDLWKSYPRKERSLLARLRAGNAPDDSELFFHAVAGLELKLFPGECLGVVGESGSGKSTLVRMIAGLLPPTRGRILLNSTRIDGEVETPSRTARARIQMVFQDPTESLNPSYTVRRTIAEPLSLLLDMHYAAAIAARVEELADLVQLPRALLDRYPHQLSGGQRARVGIARAIAPNPSVILLDEPTTALDVSVQAKILLLLADLRDRLGTSYILVTHDLSVVRILCDRVVVMNTGKIVDEGTVEGVLAHPSHPYTRSLIAALPQIRRVGEKAGAMAVGAPSR